MTNDEFIKSVSLEGEIWKDVVGYEGLYRVSNLGRVSSYNRKIVMDSDYFQYKWERICKAKIMKQSKDKGGYLIVSLYDNEGKCKNVKVHRLVASAFIPNDENLPQIDHIDCNRMNNKISNLKWCTCKENHANPNTQIKRSDRVLQINNDNEIVCEFASPKDASKKLGISHKGILSCCRKTSDTYNGFKWVYSKEYELNTN